MSGSAENICRLELLYSQLLEGKAPCLQMCVLIQANLR